MQPPIFDKVIIQAVRHRIDLLRSEIQLIDCQLPMLGHVIGTTSKHQRIAAHQRNIKATLCDLGSLYIELLSRLCQLPSPLKTVISSHLLILKQPNFQILTQELYGHQSALTTLLGQEYMDTTQDLGTAADHQIRMGCLIFPYELVFDLLGDSRFMNAFLGIIFQYSASQHLGSVGGIFRLIRNSKALQTFAARNRFFTRSSTVVFGLAEHFATFFVREKMYKEKWDPLRNFCTREKAVLISSRAVELCALNEGITERLKEAGGAIGEQPDDVDYLRKMTGGLPPFVPETIEIPALLHVVLELKKLAFQMSPSLIVFTLSTALEYLMNALSADGNAIGADEIFAFFVYVLSWAKLRFLPSLYAFVDRFVDDALRETRAQYLLAQLQGGLEFIENRVLPVQPFVLFPFRNLPSHLSGSLTISANEPIVLQGFAVFAFPSWSAEAADLFPAMLRYTGDESDIAICYQFVMNDMDSYAALVRDYPFEPVPAADGTFLNLPVDYAQTARMIKIVGGDFEAHVSDVQVLSVLMLMSDVRIDNPATDVIEGIWEAIRPVWRFHTNDTGMKVKHMVGQMQRALVKKGALPVDLEETGIMDRATLLAAQKFVYGDSKCFILMPKVYEYLRRIANEP
jgi:hypothetical protein